VNDSSVLLCTKINCKVAQGCCAVRKEFHGMCVGTVLEGEASHERYAINLEVQLQKCVAPSVKVSAPRSGLAAMLV
jgi:hypothetical protein